MMELKISEERSQHITTIAQGQLALSAHFFAPNATQGEGMLLERDIALRSHVRTL
jgi:hypothetical protein